MHFGLDKIWLLMWQWRVRWELVPRYQCRKRTSQPPCTYRLGSESKIDKVRHRSLATRQNCDHHSESLIFGIFGRSLAKILLVWDSGSHRVEIYGRDPTDSRLFDHHNMAMAKFLVEKHKPYQFQRIQCHFQGNHCYRPHGEPDKDKLPPITACCQILS